MAPIAISNPATVITKTDSNRTGPIFSGDPSNDEVRIFVDTEQELKSPPLRSDSRNQEFAAVGRERVASKDESPDDGKRCVWHRNLRVDVPREIKSDSAVSQDIWTRAGALSGTPTNWECYFQSILKSRSAAQGETSVTCIGPNAPQAACARSPPDGPRRSGRS